MNLSTIFILVDVCIVFNAVAIPYVGSWSCVNTARTSIKTMADLHLDCSKHANMFVENFLHILCTDHIRAVKWYTSSAI